MQNSHAYQHHPHHAYELSPIFEGYSSKIGDNSYAPERRYYTACQTWTVPPPP
ncbi:MAG TPA: hypothetical protein VH593_33755 [Ktedonobacteraceae bacterium]